MLCVLGAFERLEVAQRVQTILVDDLDGTDLGNGGQTIRFGWLGAEYTIDLSQANVDKFAAAITPYVNAAQRVGGRRTSSNPKPSTGGAGQVDTKAVRKWAQLQRHRAVGSRTSTGRGHREVQGGW